MTNGSSWDVSMLSSYCCLNILPDRHSNFNVWDISLTPLYSHKAILLNNLCLNPFYVSRVEVHSSWFNSIISLFIYPSFIKDTNQPLVFIPFSSEIVSECFLLIECQLTSRCFNIFSIDVLLMHLEHFILLWCLDP
jgi:hypothetical protein